MKKKSVSEKFEAALSEHARALKREGADVHASDRNMWNWRDTGLSARQCNCGFHEVKLGRKTVTVKHPAGPLLLKEGLPRDVQKEVMELLAEWGGVAKRNS